MPQTNMTHFECGLCSRKFEAGRIRNLCECGGSLLVRYDLAHLRTAWPRESLNSAVNSLWRYAPVLPVLEQTSIVSLGEGMTPLLSARRTGARIGAGDLLIKDEGLNPTGSFQARGISCAISICVELGVKAVAIASAGDAASTLSAYAAAAGLKAHIFMPADVPHTNLIECKAYGAHVTLVDGSIGDCVRIVAERCRPSEGRADAWFDIGALGEPYRIEGEKTIGYELAGQLNWTLPDAILCPAGATAMWKAFAEMEALGWIGPKRPKMIAVQAEGGLPSEVVRESGGCALAVPNREAIDAGIQLASEEGIFAAPEGAACVAAAARLIREGFLQAGDKIVLCNTGSGLKCLEAYSVRFPRAAAGETDKLGGLITPR